MVKTYCDICDRNFKDEFGLAAHNSSKHKNGTVQTKKKSYTLWFSFGLAVVVVLFIYFVYFQNSGNANLLSNNVQKVVISMQNYNYYPNTITVKVGQPVEITLDNSVGGCYRNFNIPQFGVSQYSASSSDKITFTPTEKGTFQFRCGMGMGKGAITVE